MYHRVSLIDWITPKNNDFLVVNQLEVIEKGAKKIPDVVVYVNGMPLIIIELKSASREEVNIDDAYKQLKNYMNVHIPSLFLMRVMEEKLKDVNKKNMTVSKSFSERFEKIIEKYHNRNDHLDVYEVFEELLKFKEELEEAINEGTQLGLSYEERAFFDVLGPDPDIKTLLEDEILLNIAKDLAKTAKEHRSHDWDKKESAQARMRLYIKKVLRKWDYLFIAK
ncbi:type I restriction enzyme endonuclease domain-containing protein [Bacillus sp. HNG]|uniref:type I restriction enzyme endonuclease domain-containing protein n=1 Tax=Bacillus sp. HNG TaxID=2293325 RepID=UPI0021D52BAF|nr:type I restriction enzyme endonuclease domain-containing protein [Bacillus sp. HNG]